MKRLVPFIVLAFLCVEAPAQQSDLPRIGVLDLTSENVPSAELRLLSDRLRVELHNTGQFLVVERGQMEDILKEQGFQQSGCVATECIIEVGQLVGADRMVAGAVGRVGAVYTLSLRLINVGTSAIERTAVKDCRCSLEDVLTQSIAEVAAELAGTAAVATTPTPARRRLRHPLRLLEPARRGRSPSTAGRAGKSPRRPSSGFPRGSTSCASSGAISSPRGASPSPATTSRR